MVQQLWYLYFQAEYLLCRNSPAVLSGCRTSQPTSPKPYLISRWMNHSKLGYKTLGNQQDQEVKPPRFSYSATSHPYFVIDQVYQSIEPKGHVGNFGSQPSKRKACSLLVEPSFQGKNKRGWNHQPIITHVGLFVGVPKGKSWVGPCKYSKGVSVSFRVFLWLHITYKSKTWKC